MAVVREFTLPDLGEGLTEATIVHWLVEVGEVVAIDQPVVEVETAKAMVEVPCPYGGVVTARLGAEGEEVPVGAPLVTVAVGAVPDDLAGAGPGEGPGAGAGAAGGAPDAGVSAPSSAGVAAPAAGARRMPGPGMCSSGTARAQRRRGGAGSGRGAGQAPWRECRGRPEERRTARPEPERPIVRPAAQGRPLPGQWMPTVVRWPSFLRWCVGWRGKTGWIYGS